MGNETDLRERIARFGMTQIGLARRIRELGDPRDEKVILRALQRQIARDVRVSGEMHALTGLLEEVQRPGARLRDRIATQQARGDHAT